jgi:hypothetical protein
MPGGNHRFTKGMVITFYQLALHEHTGLHLRGCRTRSTCAECKSWLVCSQGHEAQAMAEDQAMAITRMVSRVLLFVRRGQVSRSTKLEELKTLVKTRGAGVLENKAWVTSLPASKHLTN